MEFRGPGDQERRSEVNGNPAKRQRDLPTLNEILTQAFDRFVGSLGRFCWPDALTLDAV
jgi:hypothetical protein